MDVKTLLLLGAGLLVLALVAFCSEQSRAASFTAGRIRAPVPASGSGAMSAQQFDESRFLMKGEIPAVPVGATR